MNISMVIDLSSYRMKTDKATRKLIKMLLETHFEAMTLSNMAWLMVNKQAPNLYDAGVLYRRDPERTRSAELWLDLPTIYRRGYDDCEGLSAWLAAEMRVRVKNSACDQRVQGAAVFLKATKIPGSWHAVVKDKVSGEVWDPSRVLGMGRRKRRNYG